jgi:hypothetical protein
VKGTYEPTDAEAKCAFDEDEVGIIYLNIIKILLWLIYRMMKKPKKQQKLERKKKKVGSKSRLK